MIKFLETYEYDIEKNTVIISVDKKGFEYFIGDYTGWENIFDHTEFSPPGDISEKKQREENDLFVFVQLNRIEREGVDRILTFDSVNGQPGSPSNVRDNGSLIITFNIKGLYYFVDKIKQLEGGKAKSVTFTYPEELTDLTHEDHCTLVKTVRVDYLES